MRPERVIMEYIVNERGKRTRVILDIEEYERLLEATEDAEDARIARKELAKLECGETRRVLRNPR